MEILMLLGPGDSLTAAAEMLTLARELSVDRDSAPAFLLPLGAENERLSDLAALGAPVRCLSGMENQEITPEGLLFSLRTCLKEKVPDRVLMPDAGIWRSVAPALAFHLDAGYVASVRGLRRDAGGLLLGRQTWSGRRMAWLRPLEGPCVLTVVQGAFEASEQGGRPGVIESLSAVHIQSRTRFCGEEAGSGVAAGLKEARIILGAGRGVGGAEGMELLSRLEACLPGSILGGSRPVCDGGWLPYDRQIGETGADVAPELYFACGISGASQHLAGMERSGFVVVLNKEKSAPFFRHGDLGIVEDLHTFLPALLNMLEKKASG